MGLELIERALDLPALGVGGSQIEGRDVVRIEDRGEEPVGLVVVSPIIDPVINNADGQRLGSSAGVARGTQLGQPGASWRVSTKRGFMLLLARHNRSAPLRAARDHRGNPQNPRSASTSMPGSKRSISSPASAFSDVVYLPTAAS